MAVSGVEPSLGTNSFNQAKYKNESQTVANAILNLLFGKPGYFPSMPQLGMNIQNTIYMFWDEIDETVMKAQIASQCNAFKSYVNSSQLDVVKSSYGSQPLLLIILPLTIENVSETLAIGITQNSNGETSYNYVFEKTSS